MIQLSIIIPHYNSSRLLSKLLSTIPTYRDIQVIVVDDNSEKIEQKELSKLAFDDNVELYFNDSGIKGAGSCRNIGMKKAVGKWFLFADSDDYFKEDFYSIVSKYFDCTSEVIYFTPISINLDNTTIAKRHLPLKERIQKYINHPTLNNENNLRYRFSPPWSKLIQRELIIKRRIFFDEVIAANDIMFSTKVGHCLNKFEVSQEEIYCVTRSDGTLTRTMNQQIFNSRMKVFISYNNYLKENISKNEYKNLNIYGGKYLRMALNFSLLKPVYVYIKLKKQNIRIIDSKFLNPIRLIRVLIDVLFKKIRKEKIY